MLDRVFGKLFGSNSGIDRITCSSGAAGAVHDMLRDYPDEQVSVEEAVAWVKRVTGHTYRAKTIRSYLKLLVRRGLAVEVAPGDYAWKQT